MNNQMPFFNPFNNFLNMNNETPEKIINKIEQLEKSLHILESRVKKLEKDHKDDYFNDDPNDMYII